MTRLRVLVGSVLGVELLLHLSWSSIDDHDPFPSIEQQLALTAAIVVFLLPHILAFMARYERPTLLLPAGLMGVLLTVVSSISVIVLFAIPTVLIPSILYLVKWGIGWHRPIPAKVGHLLLMIPASIVAVFVLFATEDPRCHAAVERAGKRVYVPLQEDAASLPNRLEVSCTSDAIALHESGASLTLSGLIIALSWRHGATSGRESSPEPTGDPLLVDVDHRRGG